ncbi:uncharacterized protein SPAPADRAFT_134554 [Spathaspora passalidarum NRRL Y-27907]|uniref:Uncharacterized protein n=1 Tax=Spathaspora passalidarum (strain NRRL Y-27907 / 11-Y1) TaxID=619300 RepID=G3AJF5_SPAPN|nr:uncharacterized protein SPAPADRAFT_134554 [Spathaspora passalidarum NRRL Y-27907]EGW33858.1 hypothetical protein SPAPADRAFT_134554 [Spathaspora passalidarum NRRL Y-27907]
MNHIVKEVNLNGIDYTFIISYNHEINPKAPITIYINQTNNQAMGSYVYTINSYSTNLVPGSNTEQIISLNNLLTKKFQVPIYLNINGNIDCSNVELFTTIVDTIESK